MKVKVSFKDDVGLSESRTSDAEGTVAVASGSNNVPAFSGTTTTRRCCLETGPESLVREVGLRQ